MKAMGISPKYVASLTNTDKHLAAIIELIEPRGHIALIDDPETLDIPQESGQVIGKTVLKVSKSDRKL